MGHGTRECLEFWCVLSAHSCYVGCTTITNRIVLIYVDHTDVKHIFKLSQITAIVRAKGGTSISCLGRLYDVVLIHGVFLSHLIQTKADRVISGRF